MKVLFAPTDPPDLPLRRQILWLQAGQVLELFVNRTDRDSVLVPKLDLPDPVFVSHVHFSWERNAFGFSIHHPSFEVVDPSTMPPDLHCKFEVVKLARQTQP